MFYSKDFQKMVKHQVSLLKPVWASLRVLLEHSAVHQPMSLSSECALITDYQKLKDEIIKGTNFEKKNEKKKTKISSQIKVDGLN